MPFFLAPVALMQNPTITLDVPTSRLENIAPLLSKVLNEPVVVATPLLNDTLTLSVKGVSRAEFMKQIAVTANVTWSKKEKFLLLEQTSDQQRAEREYGEKKKLENITKAIEAAKKSAEKMLAFDSAEAKALKRDLELHSKQKPRSSETYDEQYYRRSAQLGKRSPYSRFMKRLVTRFTPQMVMPLSASNRHIVYSNNPTKMQGYIPFKFADLWSQLVEEQANWADVMKGVSTQPQMTDDGFYYTSMGYAGAQTEPASATPPTMNISLTTDVYGMNVSCRIRLFNREGRSITEDYVSLDANAEDAFEQWAAIREDSKKQSNEKPKWSAEAEEYSQYLKGQQTGKRRQISPKMMEQLLNPEKYVIGAQYNLEVLKFIAGGKNVISHNFANWFGGVEDFNPSYLRSPYFREYMDLNETDNWLSLAMKNRIFGRSTHIDPKLSGPIVRSASKKDCETIEDEAGFAAKMPDDEMAGYSIRAMVNAVRPYDLPVHNDQAALRVYAFLDQSARKALFGGAKVPLQKLGDKVAREFYKAIFWQDWANWEVDYESFRSKDGSYNRDFEKIQSQIYGGLLSEPTNMLPEGLTGDMLVSADENKHEILVASPDEGSRYQGVRQLDANQIGQQMFQEKNPTKYPWVNQSYNKYDKNSIRMVTQRTISIKVAIKKGIFKRFSLSEMHVKDPKVYSIDTLPESVKKQIQEGYKQAEASDKYYSSSPRQRGGTPPPPPPL